jgi:hypothetical protein
MDDAKAANLNGRKNWRSYPRRMLAARATSELCRMLFADTLTGMAWSVEELEDESDDVALSAGDANGEAPRTAKRKTATRRKPKTAKPKAEAEAQPPTAKGDRFHGTDDDTAGEPPPLPDDDHDAPPPPITPPQLTKLQAIFTEHKITDRDLRLRICSNLVNRRLGSAKDLTLSEAGVLIDTLERCAAAEEGFVQAVNALVETSNQAADGAASDAEGDPEPSAQSEQPTLGDA